MRPGVMGDGVAVQNLAPRDPRQAFGVAADLEEGRAHAFGGERVEDLRRVGRLGAVVEGDDHLVVGERYRARIGLEADFQSALGSDRLDARRAEPVGAAYGSRHSARA